MALRRLSILSLLAVVVADLLVVVVEVLVDLEPLLYQ
jgi:hypothetical protein